jgi:hypothetical protein
MLCAGYHLPVHCVEVCQFLELSGNALPKLMPPVYISAWTKSIGACMMLDAIWDVPGQ